MSPVETVRRRHRLSETAVGVLALFLRLLWIAVVGAIVFSKVFLITQAVGNEMFPAVKDGDLMIAFRLHRSYAKNDIIVYTQDGKTLIGRIAALEHDVVSMDENGILSVNGTEQHGEILYPTYAGDGQLYPHRVSEGSVYVLGDHRTAAHDSRERGDIPMDNIEGKVISLFRRRGL